jgi:hypothetical protein
MEEYIMIKQNVEDTDIDELLLNVLGGKFFKVRKIPAQLKPVISKSLDQHEITDSATKRFLKYSTFQVGNNR